jgi:F-type H+-transporting ATPase subunit b
MRRATLAVVLGLAFASYALPQEHAPTAESKSEEHGDPWLKWKWANFAILAIALGYLIGKNVPPMFRAQSQGIRQSISDAAKMKQDAEAHAAAMNQRLAGLAAEIELLRSDAHTQTTMDGERISRETAQRLEKIKNQSAAEIELMTRAGRDDLRRYAAGLAIDLAEQRVRSRISPDTQNGLVDEFLRGLRVTPGGKS